MAVTPIIALNDGRSIPQLGLGVWQIANDEAPRVVAQAIEAGYRLIDTAAAYGNEVGVGNALREATPDRTDFFITTKLQNARQSCDEALKAFDDSLTRLGLTDVDLYLIHWPAPAKGLFIETWRALIELRRRGKTKSIGVSNFEISHLKRIFDETGVPPTINQIELHPRFQQAELRQFHARHGIVTESWSPLGRGTVLNDPTIVGIAHKHRKTPAQVVLRWHLELGLVVIPRSADRHRIRENIAVFDFSLDEEDMALIGRLDSPTGRVGPNPLTFA